MTAVVPGWSPMKISRRMALGSVSVVCSTLDRDLGCHILGRMSESLGN